jgi:uncharacterized protein
VLRVVIDPGVLVSALISRVGTPAGLLRQWLEGAFDLLVSPALLAELEDVLSRSKFRRHFTDRQASAFIALLRERALEVADADDVDPLTRDPADDYLVALARAAGADLLVSGDKHLTSLADPPVRVITPRDLLTRLR